MENKELRYSSDLPIKDKIAIIKDNYRITSNANRRSISFSAQNSFSEPLHGPIQEQMPPVAVDENFLALYQKVVTSSVDEIPMTILSMISPSNLNYTRYINMLKIALYKDITSLSNLAFESQALDDEDIQKMYDELLDIYYAIDGLEEEEELIASSQNSKNTLFFRTSLNRVIPYEDIDKGIPCEIYDKVLELITGLIDGHFKGLKYLSAKKMFEVRLGQIRITFVRISKNKFLVLNCFLKKYNTSKEYRERLTRVRDQYLGEIDEYVAKSDDPEFISEHQKYLEDIISLCQSDKRGLK